MADVTALVGTAIDTVKKLREVAEKIKDADTRNLIADLQLSLADLKIEVARLKEENLELKQGLAQEKATKSVDAETEVRGCLLYFAKPQPSRPAGPYCVNCYGNGGRLVLLEDERNSPFSTFGNYHCPACDSWFR